MSASTTPLQVRAAGTFSRVSGLPGCKSSLVTSQNITSSGVSGINGIFGGGVPVGTVLAFEDKPYVLHSKRFLLAFAAEGLAVGHRVAVAMCHETYSAGFVSSIPAKLAESGVALPCSDGPEVRSPVDASRLDEAEGLSIAWRYQKNPKVNPVIGPSVTADGDYDFGKKIAPSGHQNLSTFGTDKTRDSSALPRLSKLIQWVYKESIKSTPQNILRICLPEIDSPLWECQDFHEFSRLLYQLKSIVRHTNTIVFLSLSHNLHELGELPRIRRLCDAYIATETLQDSTKSALYREFQAICRIQKSFSINALKPVSTADYEFGLKFERRKIILERLHIPPELEDTAQREASSRGNTTASGNKINCRSATEHALDF